MAKKIKVRLIRSLSGSLPKQRATVRCLGLRKIGSVREYEATPVIEGMIRVVSHLVSVEEVSNSLGV
ncbi:MAG: 50S ribosomal protein L30 [Treponema sp.]|jgi:large subunit ribosomal protein L30|nr:50S ribosomal protein L30 [Treponema sp.]